MAIRGKVAKHDIAGSFESADQMDENTSVVIYSNGYVVFQCENQATVFPLQECRTYEYISVKERQDSFDRRLRQRSKAGRTMMKYPGMLGTSRQAISDSLKKSLGNLGQMYGLKENRGKKLFLPRLQFSGFRLG